MNVVFFLTPKTEVVWLPDRSTMREAIERMEQSGYTAVPLLDDGGRYAGTLAEGDLLRRLTAAQGLTLADTEKVVVRDIPRRANIRAVGVDAQMEELFSRAVEQNFVPVVDSRGVFIGIVRRRAILEYCAGLLPGAAAR